MIGKEMTADGRLMMQLMSNYPIIQADYTLAAGAARVVEELRMPGVVTYYNLTWQGGGLARVAFDKLRSG